MKTFTKIAAVGRAPERPPATDDGPAVLLPRNYVHGCLLLLLGESSTHGYDLLEQLVDLGLRNVDSSAVYRALRHLNGEGLVESWWVESDVGPARRCYRITAAGSAALDDWASSVAATSTVFRMFLLRHRRRRARIA